MRVKGKRFSDIEQGHQGRYFMCMEGSDFRAGWKMRSRIMRAWNAIAAWEGWA